MCHDIKLSTVPIRLPLVLVYHRSSYPSMPKGPIHDPVQTDLAGPRLALIITSHGRSTSLRPVVSVFGSVAVYIGEGW